MPNQSEKYTLKALLVLLAFLVGADFLARVTASTHAAPAPAAGLPDTGAQFNSMIEELKSVNRHLDSIQSTLDSGKMTVRTVPVDTSK